MSVHSKDGKTWLTKLDRIGELSAKDQTMVFNNLGHMINRDMLKELFQRLDGNKAVGIDGVRKEEYEETLDENIDKLMMRIRRGTYRPKPARIKEIPKEDGSTRPLAICCLEDKLVQLAASTILNKIYEPLFLKCSFGFRPNLGCHDALRALHRSVFRNWDGAFLEVDIQKYFNRIPHDELMDILRRKISDSRFIRLIEVLISAPIQDENGTEENTRGCPQGSIVSPILANIFLHHVIDEWFETIRKSHIKGRSELIRYADDLAFTFEHTSEAARFFAVLPKRLGKYGLEMHPEKSRIIPAGHNAASRAHRQGTRLPTFNFLGFTCYWGKSKNGHWRLKCTSRRDRFANKLAGMKKFLRKNLNTRDTTATLKTVIRGIRGWVNYHGISDNARRVNQFLERSKRLILRWINRRGRKRPCTWNRLLQILKALGFPSKWKTVSMFQAH